MLPKQPLHVTQSSVNCTAISLDDQDRHHYRRLLREACTVHHVPVHALVLMDNHVRLLLTPPSADALAQATRIKNKFEEQNGRR